MINTFKPREQSVREDDYITNDDKYSPDLISVRHIFDIYGFCVFLINKYLITFTSF